MSSSRGASQPWSRRTVGLWAKGVVKPPAPGEMPDVLPDSGTATRARRALCCAACGHRITSDEHRMEVDGKHVHTRLNPAGFLFRFGCFDRADGCMVIGPPTLEHTWFSGFTWQFAACKACQMHLGWCFAGEGAFFGLILDRLTEVS